MIRAIFAIPGDINTRTGGYIYDRRVIELLPGCGIEANVLRLPASFPFPDAGDIDECRRQFGEIAPGNVVVADGLAWGAMPPDIARSLAVPVIALCHHPLGLEAGLSAEQSTALIANERETLAAAAHVIVTSRATAATLRADFGVAAAKITVAEPGTDPAARAHGGGAPPLLVAAGSIVPRKGHDVLVSALASLRHLDWRLAIAGSPDRAPDCAAALRAQVEASGLTDNIALLGEISDSGLAALYSRADIFVSASHYEGYGMVLSEALARGLPVVTTTGGAAADTVPDGAGLKVPPGDSYALARALERTIGDTKLRKQLSDGAWQAAQTLPRWSDTAAKIAGVIRTVSQAQGARA